MLLLTTCVAEKIYLGLPFSLTPAESLCTCLPQSLAPALLLPHPYSSCVPLFLWLSLCLSLSLFLSLPLSNCVTHSMTLIHQLVLRADNGLCHIAKGKERHRDTVRGKKRKREQDWEGGWERERETERKERGVVEVSLWMWSLKMLKCCIYCEHPSNGKSMMGRALRRSQGCYIKAEVLHQRFSGSTYWCLFGFVRLLNHFHWFLPLSLVEMLYSFHSCHCVRIYAQRPSACHTVWTGHAWKV